MGIVGSDAEGFVDVGSLVHGIWFLVVGLEPAWRICDSRHMGHVRVCDTRICTSQVRVFGRRGLGMNLRVVVANAPSLTKAGLALLGGDTI